MNIRNHGVAIGRLTRDVVVFNNSDGSKKVMLTLAVQDNFKSGKDKTRATQFLPMEAFVSKSATDIGVYKYMHKGDLVGIEYSVRSNNFKNAEGKDEYRTVLFIQSVDLMESKKTTDARHAGEGEAPEAAPAQDQGIGDPADMDAPFGE